MDHHAMSHGTMVGTLVGSLMNGAPATDARRHWIVMAAVLPSLALGGLLLTALPAYALPTSTRDAGLQALQTPRLAVSPTEKMMMVAAKGGRLLKNGTRSREGSEKSEDKTPPASESAASEAAADSAAVAKAAPASPAPDPTAGPAPAVVLAPARPAAAASGPVDLREQLTPVAGMGRNESDIECVANCVRSTPTVRLGGRQAPDPSLTEGGMECIAGCYGVNMTSVIVDRQELPVAARQGEAQGSGPASNRITVLRGVTRTKTYTPAN